ncbi:MAG TPA: cytochrome c biogenesis protein CcsA [Verrucomicrobiae bacterium]|nr:cytochrome c biogenesis protein CcsA [Verrucomicrobiae bacterium]
MKKLVRFLPWCFVALFATEIIAVLMPKRDGEFHWRAFGRLPVLLNGRIQPFDSVARNSLLQIRSTGDVPLEEVPSWQFWHHPKKLKSTEWLLEVMARPEVADTRPVFLIHSPELLGELKLDDKGVDKSGLRYYTFEQLKPVLKTISDQSQRAGEVKAEEQTPFQKQVVKLANAVMLYQRLKVTLQPEGADDFAKEIDDFLRDLGPAQAAAQASEGGKQFDREALERMAQPLQDFQMMAKFGYPLVVPPVDPAAKKEDWENAGTSLLESARHGTVHPAVGSFAKMMTAYRQEQPADFNQAVDQYSNWLQPQFQKELRKGRAEFFYNDTKPFLHAIIIYIFAFILALASVLCLAATPVLAEQLRRSAFYLVILAGIVHTFGLVFRMVLEGRPPVTNLYSSAIFIGWGTMVLGLIIERIYRVGIGALVGSLAGFITLLIAQNLAIGGDTMEMLRAVLDTNFWLATHVVVITLGYASTFFAGLLAILYIFLGLATPLLAQKLGARGKAALVMAGKVAGGGFGAAAAARAVVPDKKNPGELTLGKALSKMVYGIVCFATLFSFVGTVLGGIWADQSWGRFWGWDPKENGALLIVLWNALILHARWGGLVRERGIMNLAVFGNIITSFSWFGVNMLQIGLHSYGFMEGASKWLLIFVGSQLAIIVLGLLPLSVWRSFRVAKAPVKGAKDAKAGTPQPAVT